MPDSNGSNTIWFWDFLAKTQNVFWLEWAKTIFDLLKGIAWPLVVFLLFFMFRAQLQERIKHLVSAGPTGAVFQPSQPSEPPTPSTLKTVRHPMSMVNENIELIQRQLLDIPENERTTRLISALAEAQIEAQFEFLFGSVFGSQIAALRVLARGMVTLDEAKKFFEEEVVPLNKTIYSEWGFDEWSRFLTSQQLAEINGDHVEITDRGRDFLLFVDVKKAGVPRYN
ncbi:hypothetical protein [Pararhizobium sp.]|uniref:hypothetical protein n=1 Tax=Pararhizobium sp. TaxID=1977563 RepID=UPI003D146CE0